MPDPTRSRNLGAFLTRYAEGQKPPLMVLDRTCVLVGDGMPLASPLGFDTADEWYDYHTTKGQPHDDHD